MSKEHTYLSRYLMFGQTVVNSRLPTKVQQIQAIILPFDEYLSPREIEASLSHLPETLKFLFFYKSERFKIFEQATLKQYPENLWFMQIVSLPSILSEWKSAFDLKNILRSKRLQGFDPDYKKRGRKNILNSAFKAHKHSLDQTEYIKAIKALTAK